MAALFGRRLRRGATTTAVAAAAIAALSASQAPGAIPTDTDTDTGSNAQAADATPPPGTPVSGNSPYYTELPPLTTPDAPGASIDLPAITGPAEAGIPATVLAAYRQAEQALKESRPGCNLPWQLLAAIGKVESGQARGGRVDAFGTTLSPILGPVLNGVGFANITDTDGGAYDGDTTHDRAVGPMQFIPSTWATWGQDANNDGRKDPNNIYDAALAAGQYLCAGNRDLSVEADLHQAILGYNHSQEYLNTVLSWFEYYKNGTHAVPDGTGVLPVGPGPGNPGPGMSPSPSPGPSAPGKPGAKPTKPGTSPSKPPVVGTPKPPAPGTGDPSTPAPDPVVARIEKTASSALSAVAGGAFDQRPGVRAEDASGKPVAGVPVRFEIVGSTDASFSGGASGVTVETGADGTATAPALQAGEQTGEFTVRASVAVTGVDAVEYTASVTARQVDALARTTDGALTAAPGAEFGTVEVKATSGGVAVGGVAVTAEITSADGVTPVGAHFKDAAGNPLHSLTGLTTDANGVLQLPALYADDTAGTFLLRLQAEGGATLTIELNVVAPAV
ncbi:lytic murein transglycosylase [Streptomyces sp. GMY02]|uniref:lytic transglycosylase domain-containing protein n=1 Tax=Streptomyces sp. GMY02 TaxID=1333528 RepID=UPI001C2C7143|nr:lytic murein transglycosylase [Streptomyces sp. GMY02]QXE37406.1 lytic murein transglycosylase [Streptomyces sp. GMY02]